MSEKLNDDSFYERIFDSPDAAVIALQEFEAAKTPKFPSIERHIRTESYRDFSGFMKRVFRIGNEARRSL
jgi:hypothetical protein